MNIRTLIVDDEPLARRGIRTLLEAEPDVTVVGECAGAAEASAAIRRFQPDLVFLDVQMPDGTGFDVLDAIEGEPAPVVVFVTAYDQFALQAFEVRALDYLLKPFDDERFARALDRARRHLDRARPDPFADKLEAIIAALDGFRSPRPERPTYLDRLAVRAGGCVQFFRVDEVDWIEAAGDYMCLHVGPKPHFVREKMRSLEDKLDPRRFVRIHRSTIVNVDRIRELRNHDNGGYLLYLNDGTELRLSRSYQHQVFTVLGEAS